MAKQQQQNDTKNSDGKEGWEPRVMSKVRVAQRKDCNKASNKACHYCNRPQAAGDGVVAPQGSGGSPGIR